MSEKNTKGDRTRDLILTQAIRLFSKYGYDGTSFQMIADKCEIAQSIPLYHFRDKEGLFAATVRHCQARQKEVILESYDISDHALARLKKYCLGLFNWTNVYRSQAQILMLLGYFASTHEEFVPLYKEQVLESRKEIEAFLLAGQREGLFHFEKPSHILAQLIHEATLGICINFIATRSLVNMREIEDKFQSFLEVMVNYERKQSKSD